MPNNITLAQQFVPLLDEIYKLASLTSGLDGSPELVKEGANAGELIIPMLSMQGLADYSRNSGYVDGDVSLTNETVRCNFDRGRMFTVDTMDDLETAGIAFGRLAGEFIRTKVVPELDAFRFACYAGKSGISKVATGATLADGATVLKAIRAADSNANVVMCSAMGQESMVMDAVRSGAKDFIVKPFKPDRVLKTVSTILGNP